MRALSITQPGTTAYVDLPVPTAGAGDVLLQVLRVGFCGSDLSTFRGANPLVQYPRIPGHEIAGRVIQKGTNVPAEIALDACVTVIPYTACGLCPSCRAGRTNACQHNQTLGVQRDGGLTDMIVIPWQKIRSAPLPLPELTLVEPLSVGFHAVARAKVNSGDTVLVIGCGMIGLGAIAAAGMRVGATVIAADVAPSKLDLARNAGATHVIDSSQENLVDRARALTRGDGPSVVIEAVGAVETYQAAVTAAAFSGRVVYIGYGKVPVAYETKYFVMKELDILGSRNATSEDFQAVIEMLKGGQYPTAETITRTVAWTEAGEALAAWAAKPSAITKIHVDLGHD